MLHHFVALTECQCGYCRPSAAGDSGGTVAVSVRCQLRINNAEYQNNGDHERRVQGWQALTLLSLSLSPNVHSDTGSQIIC